MSTHVITEAMLAKSNRDIVLRRSPLKRLKEDWNEHVDLWAGNEKVGTIAKTFDTKARTYPHGFRHDITVVKPLRPSNIKDITSPVSHIGWLNYDAWAALRQQTSEVKFLAPTETERKAKTLKSSRPSDILVVGEGIFLNHTAAAGSTKTLHEHDTSAWKDFVSRALLYRVRPDFDPPNGYSGIALYAHGTRNDGIEGPGIAGFQSFVQRNGHVQNFEMERPALERRLQLGRVAFYGAFEVPEALKEYKIV
ncbi:hypothetical protein NX059_010834 [Plenodomus lindquistii]|nr:hypothetical protein NX059_010834 [Plenodomus lindquistii]